jgi:hypothetical protein
MAISDGTYLDELYLSERLKSTLRLIICLDKEYEGRREMTFGNLRTIPLEKIDLSSFDDMRECLREWEIFLNAPSNAEAARTWAKIKLSAEIQKQEKALASMLKGVLTQTTKLEALRSQLASFG